VATDPTRLTVAQQARVYLAPTGTLAPADESAALDPAWREVGLFTPDSLRFTDDPNFESVTSHQSSYPTRRFQTTDAATVQVDLQEFSGKNMIAVMGGGVITQVSTGHYKYSPPAVGGRSQVAAIVQIEDGSRRFRIVIPVAIDDQQVQFDLRKANETTLPLRLTVIGSDVGDPWYMLTNAADWSPSAT
jgi:hypothetical protein